jgi:hypothetical protein
MSTRSIRGLSSILRPRGPQRSVTVASGTARVSPTQHLIEKRENEEASTKIPKYQYVVDDLPI